MLDVTVAIEKIKKGLRLSSKCFISVSKSKFTDINITIFLIKCTIKFYSCRYLKSIEGIRAYLFSSFKVTRGKREIYSNERNNKGLVNKFQ